MTLKEAIEEAAFYADQRGPVGWHINFIASLRANGYAVVEKALLKEVIEFLMLHSLPMPGDRMMLKELEEAAAEGESDA